MEVIGPESRSRERGEKFYEYEKGGVPECWLIDPDRKQAEFYHRDAKGIYQLMRLDKNGVFRSKVLNGFWLRVAWLWQKPTPPLQVVLKEWKLT